MSDLPVILALDMATRTGWALRSRAGAVLSGVVRLPSERRGRVQDWCLWVQALAAEWRPEVLAYEQPVLARMRGGVMGAAAHRVAANLEGVLLANSHSTRVLTCTPAEVKKHATGKGNAPKARMVEAACERWGLEAVEDDNEADALCVLAWALEQIGEDP